MFAKCSLMAVGVAGLLMAQHGGGGGGHAGGGGGGFHSSVGSSGFRSGGGGGRGYTTSITPQSYSGHLTFSTPGMGTTGLNRGSNGFVEARPTWGRPPIRRPIGGGGGEHDRYHGYYGIGYYPVIGYGYYGDDFSSTYYSSNPEPQYYAPYEQAPDTGGDSYSPTPYASYPQEQQQPMPQAAPEPQPPAVPLTIVLKSGQKMDVQNYAIMNGLFWDFSKPNAKKIPLSEVDVAASMKATDAAGGAFPEESFGANPR